MDDISQEDKWLREAASGDTKALDALITLYHPRLRSFVKGIFPTGLAAWLDPDDILQETYFSLHRGIASFTPQGDEAFFRWAATIARARLIDQIKSVQAFKRRGQLKDEGDRRISDVIDQHLLYKRTPSASAAAHELVEVVDQSIQALPEDYRKILLLRHDQKLSPQEAAKQMNRSKSAAQTLYWRALKALREKLRSKSVY